MVNLNTMMKEKTGILMKNEIDKVTQAEWKLAGKCLDCGKKTWTSYNININGYSVVDAIPESLRKNYCLNHCISRNGDLKQ